MNKEMSFLAISEYFRKMGVKGGKARAKRLTPKRRQEIARNAGRAPKKTRQR